MSCDDCRSLDFQDISGDPRKLVFHETFADLAKSAEDGCDLCGMVEGTLEWMHEEIGNTPEVYTGREVYLNSGNPFSIERGQDTYLGMDTVMFSQSLDGGRGTGVPFGIFVQPKTALAETFVISGRPISKFADSDVSLNLIRKWLTECLGNHNSSCPHNPDAILPTRVIDLGLPGSDSQPFLRINDGGTRGTWVALSHCWGSIARFVTDSNTLNTRRRSIPLNEVPPTFRDAINISRCLGYRYLWIDSLCIVQDDRTDWVRESAQMQNYYKQAILTINADAAEGDHKGFLPIRHHSEDNIILGSSAGTELEKGHEIYIRENLDIPEFTRGDTYLTNRAWTLQEDILSPRTIHFTTEQLVWECQYTKRCESSCNRLGAEYEDVYQMRKRFFLNPTAAGDKFPDHAEYMQPTHRWYNLVSDYVTRFLTNECDLFPAISGIAQEICQQTGYTYVAGIWLEDFHRGLLWQGNGGGKLSCQYRAPSWSWASLDFISEALEPRNALYSSTNFSSGELIDFRATLLTHDVQLADGFDFGRLLSGYITLRGRFTPGITWQDKFLYVNAYWMTRKSHFIDWLGRRRVDSEPNFPDQVICTFDWFPEDSTEMKPNLESIFFFQISAWKYEFEDRPAVSVALMLERGEERSSFRRVGIVEIPHVHDLAERGIIK